MRVTVCELPHETNALAEAWESLCEHTTAHESQLVLLPEFAFIEPVWESELFDASRWNGIETLSEIRLRRLPELRAEYVVGTRPLRVNGRRLNQAFLWTAADGVLPLRSKYFLPQEPGTWEATWFERGDETFSVFEVLRPACEEEVAEDGMRGARRETLVEPLTRRFAPPSPRVAGRGNSRSGLSFGVNICTELWALETYAAYAALGVEIVLTPRATELSTMKKWIAAGVVAAVRSGAFSVSSNRVEPSGACGGGGWIIDPSGEVLAVTSASEPFATRELDLAKAAQAKTTYPRYVFS